jgi:hypothetical protein
MVWTKVGAKIEEALDSITFFDLLQQPAVMKPKKKMTLAGKGGC